MGENSAFKGASIGGCTRAAEDRLRRESILIRAVGGGVDRSSVVESGGFKSGRNSLAKSVARYSLPVRGSNSLGAKVAVVGCSVGVRGYASYEVYRGDCTRR